MIDITGLREDKRPQSSTIVHALLDRLEAAEADALEQARLNGMGASREAALIAKLEAAEKSDAESLEMYRRARDERDALRAALTDLLNDLEERAPLNIEKSPRVVACGNSVYVQAKAALEATP